MVRPGLLSSGFSSLSPPSVFGSSVFFSSSSSFASSFSICFSSFSSIFSFGESSSTKTASAGLDEALGPELTNLKQKKQIQNGASWSVPSPWLLICTGLIQLILNGWPRFLGHSFWLHLLSCPRVVFKHCVHFSLVVVGPFFVVLQLLLAYRIHVWPEFQTTGSMKALKRSLTFLRIWLVLLEKRPVDHLTQRVPHTKQQNSRSRSKKNSQENTVLHLLHCHAAEPSTPKSTALPWALEPSTCESLNSKPSLRMQQIQFRFYLCLTRCCTAVKSGAPTTIWEHGLHSRAWTKKNTDTCNISISKNMAQGDLTMIQPNPS